MVQCDRIIIILLAVVVTIPVVVKSCRSRLEPVSATFLLSTSSRGYVGVSGDVRHPGVYPLTANMLTIDAIKLAGPLQPATGFIPSGVEKLAIQNGTDLKLARKRSGVLEVKAGSMSAAHCIVLGIPMDINLMTQEDLDLIPGVGPALARRVVEYRQLNGGKMGIQDLIFIDGIGENKYMRLKKYFK